jgi:hypothetical protein
MSIIAKKEKKCDKKTIHDSVYIEGVRTGMSIKRIMFVYSALLTSLFSFLPFSLNDPFYTHIDRRNYNVSSNVLRNTTYII